MNEWINYRRMIGLLGYLPVLVVLLIAIRIAATTTTEEPISIWQRILQYHCSVLPPMSCVPFTMVTFLHVPAWVGDVTCLILLVLLATLLSAVVASAVVDTALPQQPLHLHILLLLLLLLMHLKKNQQGKKETNNSNTRKSKRWGWRTCCAMDPLIFV